MSTSQPGLLSRKVQHVLLTDDNAADIAPLVAEARPELTLTQVLYTQVTQAQLNDADAYLGFKRRPGLNLEGLAYVHCSGAGYDAFTETEPTLPTTIPLTRTMARMPDRMAEYVLSRCLAHVQHMAELMRQQRRAAWIRQRPRLLRGTRAMVLGTGRIGGEIGATLQRAGVTTWGVSRQGRPHEAFDEILSWEEARTRLAETDTLISVLPRTPETDGVLDASIFGAMRGGQFINVGRGTTLDLDALLAALNAGHVGAAALDVFPAEPLDPASPFWSHPNVHVSPHIAGLTEPEEVAGAFLDGLGALERGEAPTLGVAR